MRRETVFDLPVWCDVLERGAGGGGKRDRVAVRFTGRGAVPRPPRREVLAALEPRWDEGEKKPPEVAWAEQIHSARVLEASAGSCGEGDALVADRPGLALSVVTADCVPVLLASCDRGGPIAAVHAGWRGIAAEIVARTLDRLAVPAASLVAWIGPAIGPCCYEVGPDVAERVARVSTPDAVRPSPDSAAVPGNPHLDLRRAVRAQLEAAGVEDVRSVECCTRCHPRELWSYRREGERAGRNYSFVWVAG
jgi:YfiH family protein